MAQSVKILGGSKRPRTKLGMTTNLVARPSVLCDSECVGKGLNAFITGEYLTVQAGGVEYYLLTELALI